MNIGIVCGEKYHLTMGGANTSPDFITQGLLVRKLIEEGHRVTLFTPLVRDDGPVAPLTDYGDPRWFDSFLIADGEDLDGHELDLVISDKIRRDNNDGTYIQAIRLLKEAARLGIPCLHHQTIAYTGFSPPFKEHPELLATSWSVMNRAAEPEKLWAMAAGRNEGRLEDIQDEVRFFRWEPFWQLDPFFGQSLRQVDPVEKEWRVGYIGRLKNDERRTARLHDVFMNVTHRKVLWGNGVVEKFCREVNADYGGPVTFDQVSEKLSSCWMTVNCPFDRLVGLDSWPNRFIENAIAGVFQVFLSGFGDLPRDMPGVCQWDEDAIDIIDHMTENGFDDFWHDQDAQRRIILDRADPTKVTRNLMRIIEEAAR